MNSMTGYGRSSEHNDKLEVTIEINSVNRKSLDIFTSLPREWQPMEKRLLDSIRSALLRGKVNVNVQVKDLTQTSGLSWNEGVVSETLAALKKLAAKNDIALQPNGELLMRVVTALGSASELPGWDEHWALVETVLQRALGELQSMRATEGKALLSDLRLRVETMQQAMVNVKRCAEAVVPHYRDQLLQRLQKVGLEVDLEDERVLKEIALFADRCDIAEELTRLLSHFEQFITTMNKAGAVGRKLDFLCQEINREINTIGSKANSLDITKHVIECKNELERIREQVQNVE